MSMQYRVSKTWQAGMTIFVSAAVLSLLSQPSGAESLFRASANYNANNQPYTPHSLYTQPRPQSVGDTVTVLVDEQTQQTINAQLRSDSAHTVSENGTSIFNNTVRTMLDKLPFIDLNKTNGIGQKTANLLAVPSMDGLDNRNIQSSRVQSQQSTRLEHIMSCQVVEILPNGYLVVQGHKATTMNKERTDMFITGIVNPFYINRNNEIPSTRVANLQFHIGGKGTVSRQQTDGFTSKVMQFFN